MNGIGTIPFGLHLLSAIFMGAIVGLERQWRQRMAGTRTNALVAAGAAAFVMCGFLLARRLICPWTHRLLRCVGSRFPRRWRHLQGRRQRARTQYRCHNLVFRRYWCALRAWRAEPGVGACRYGAICEHGAPPARPIACILFLPQATPAETR